MIASVLLAAGLAAAPPPAPQVVVRPRGAVVRVAGKARKYRLHLRESGQQWHTVRTSRTKKMILRLDAGRYRVRAQVLRRQWSRPGRPSTWFRVTAPTPIGPAQVIWVDPVNGDDGGDGSRARPVASLTAAWAMVPAEPATEVRIEILPGHVGESPNYWEYRRGTARTPITIAAANGPGTVSLANDINMFEVHHLRLKHLTISREGDVFHCERCSHITLDAVDFDGRGAAHETVKVNQSQHIDILDSRIRGSYENAIDFVAVQWSRIAGNEISHADDWCAYAKGGSAYIEVTDNVIHHCGTGGFTAGQGTGFEFMVQPWLRYEAYGVDVHDNLIHDTEGAGLGVNGGYNIRMWDNVLVRTGSRSHTVEFVHGSRSCDGDVAGCAANHAAGGWGGPGIDGQFIPSRKVWFGNNVIANPPSSPSRWQQVTVADPVIPPAGSAVPSPARADDRLTIVNNIFWNNAPDTGYAPLAAGNEVNTVDPRIDPGTLRPGVRLPPVSVPVFGWEDAGVPAP